MFTLLSNNLKYGQYWCPFEEQISSEGRIEIRGKVTVCDVIVKTRVISPIKNHHLHLSLKIIIIFGLVSLLGLA